MLHYYRRGGGGGGGGGGRRFASVHEIRHSIHDFLLGGGTK